jgi:hypothetical protein
VHSHADGIAEAKTGELVRVGGLGGAEEGCAALLGNAVEQQLKVGFEAGVEEAVSLVKDEELEAAEVKGGEATDGVNCATGGANDGVGALGVELGDVIGDSGAAGEELGGEGRINKVGENGVDLVSELARGAEGKHARLVLAERGRGAEEELRGGKSEGKCLATSSDGFGENVAVLQERPD